jgi:hypothetical protein
MRYSHTPPVPPGALVQRVSFAAQYAEHPKTPHNANCRTCTPKGHRALCDLVPSPHHSTGIAVALGRSFHNLTG